MKQMQNVQDWSTITIDVVPVSRRIKPGERIKLSWKVANAERAYLLQQPGCPFEITGVVVEWAELEQSGKAVNLHGEIKLVPKFSTTFIIAAVGQAGRWAKSITVRVDSKKALRTIKAKTWNHFDEPPGPEEFINLYERDRDLRRAVVCAIRGPQVELSIDRCCLYTDEPAHIEWHVTCANCVDGWTHIHGARLEEDRTSRSGTQVEYFFEGEGLTRIDTITRCLLPRRGDIDVNHVVAFGTEPGSEWTWTVLAEDHRGRSEVGSVTAWFLPHPRIEGCSPARRVEIEEALLKLCGLLQHGCIAGASGLDRSVAAFRDGHLARSRVASELTRQLWNLDIITFKCADVSDADWRGSQWEEFTNVIELQWSPSHRPYLPYVILHELLHKVGFNGDLSPFYRDVQIEHQANQVARACFPQLPPSRTPED